MCFLLCTFGLLFVLDVLCVDCDVLSGLFECFACVLYFSDGLGCAVFLIILCRRYRSVCVVLCL